MLCELINYHQSMENKQMSKMEVIKRIVVFLCYFQVINGKEESSASGKFHSCICHTSHEIFWVIKIWKHKSYIDIVNCKTFLIDPPCTSIKDKNRVCLTKSDLVEEGMGFVKSLMKDGDPCFTFEKKKRVNLLFKQLLKILFVYFRCNQLQISQQFDFAIQCSIKGVFCINCFDNDAMFMWS